MAKYKQMYKSLPVTRYDRTYVCQCNQYHVTISRRPPEICLRTQATPAGLAYKVINDEFIFYQMDYCFGKADLPTSKALKV